jgi:magnesium-protoporphyrin IX monomethyl ester (oxidative) cyclase
MHGDGEPGPHKVVLVAMPYASVERPSLALGTLAAVLDRAGISVRVIHGNLMFAERIGRIGYESINNTDITLQMGEWTFSQAAFRTEVCRAPDYVAGLGQMAAPQPDLAKTLLAIRAEAECLVDELAETIVASHPRIVGCSSVFQQHCASLALLRCIKELDPAIVTMMGGANCEAEMGVATHDRYRWVDFMVSGEADKLLPDLCRLIFQNGCEVPASELPDGVLGPASRDAAAGSAPAPRAMIADLDELPIPNFDDYFAQLESSPLRDYVIPGLPIETSRGCWWGAKHHCTFCGLNGIGMAFRAKSEERTRQEMRYLAERYNLKKFNAVDNILNTKYFNRVLPWLAERGDMLVFYETKANLRKSQVEMLARAGVRWIQPGIEAMHDGLLALLEKGCSVVINVQLLKWAYNNGIWVTWNHLYGAPGDKLEWYDEVAEWLPAIAHLQPPAGGTVTQIRFDRFSPYFNKPASYGLDLAPHWGYSQVYPVGGEHLAAQAYFFQHIGLPGPEPERLRAVVQEWSRLFYRQDGAPSALPERARTAPVLEAEDDGDTATIRDTRPCATVPRHDLTVLESRICRACDTACGARGIVEAVRRAGGDESETAIAAARKGLVERKIVMDFNGKFLCLATVANAPPYVGFEHFAGGLFVLGRRKRAPLPADPWQMSVQSLFQSS